MVKIQTDHMEDFTMARRERKSDRLPEGWLKGFIEAYDIKSADDINNALTDLVGGTVETMLQAELEDELGYAKHDIDNKNTENSRNDSSSKKVRSDHSVKTGLNLELFSNIRQRLENQSTQPSGLKISIAA
jgi:hypothetical protein